MNIRRSSALLLLLSVIWGFSVPRPAWAQAAGKVDNYSAQMTQNLKKPWTFMIPDPDKIDWKSLQDRPGYRFRGMLPTHERFYRYFQNKIKNNLPIQFWDRMMMRALQRIRRWPEAPVPSEAALVFMRYLRNLDRSQLNTAELFMLCDIWTSGVMPYDLKPDPSIQPLVDYLQSGPFEPRNYWERAFGRAEDYLDWTAAMLVDTRVGGSFTFPVPPLDGVQVGYNISGADITSSKESRAGVIQAGRGDNGMMNTKGTLRFWGPPRPSGVHQALFQAYLRAGTNSKVIERKISDRITVGIPISSGYTFDLSVPIPELPPPPGQGFAPGNFWVSIDTVSGTLGQPDYKVHSMVDITGYLRRPDEIKPAADTTDWKAVVEGTLTKLGYENTPEGKKLKEMRTALNSGPAAWNAYTARQTAAFNADKNEKDRVYECIKQAMEVGGRAWDDFVSGKSCAGGAGGGGTPPGPAGGGAAPPGGQPGSKPAPAAVPGGTEAAALAGTWNWVPPQVMTARPDHTFEVSEAGKTYSTGRWESLGGSQYRLVHNDGVIDTVTMSSDGKSLNGVNNHNYHFGASRAGGDASVLDLGRVWSVVEVGEWLGTWTRRGTGIIFDAVWTNKNAAGEWRDELTVESTEGNRIVLYRKGMNGRYTGTFSADRKSIGGSASWYQPGQSWTATIKY